MTVKDEGDLQALQAAKSYMGRVAWPTVILAVSIFAAYVSTPVLMIMGVLPLLVAAPVMALLTYAAYTILHDAAHGSISGSNRSLRWLNEALGYAAGWIVMIPLTAHRHEHLAHHRNTNEPEADPNYFVGTMTRSPMHALAAAVEALKGQFTYYMNNRWGKGPRSQDLYLCLEVCAALLPRLAFCAAGFWVEGLLLFVVAWLCGVALLLFLFAYLVHRPHETVGRYVDTSTFVIDGALGRIITPLWGYQNYHSIHHLFPRVPFYYYRRLFDEIEPVMLARGAPVYRLNAHGVHSYTTVQT